VIIQDSRQPQMREEGEIVVTARRRKGQLIITQASVDGDRTYAVIDTGSELTIGNSAMLRRALRGRSKPPMQTISLVSVTGASFSAEVTTLAELRVGGVLLKNVTVAFTDAPPFELFGLEKQPALLLGPDLLRISAIARCVSYCADRNHLPLVLRKGHTISVGTGGNSA
jgi:hypothetical protein